MKLKKHHYVFIIAALIFIFTVSFTGRSDNYEKYKNYSYAYFPVYSTINNKLSEKDKEIADIIIGQATGVFTFKGETQPSEDVGKLKRYYHIAPGTTRVDLSIEPIAGNFRSNKGYVWVVYSVARYDEENEITNGSWDILSYWKAEKQDDGTWKVIDIKEAA